MRGIFLLAALLLWRSGATQNLSLFFGDTVFVEPGGTVQLHLRATGFQQVGAGTFTMSWDTTHLHLLQALPQGLSNLQPNTSDGSLVAAWSSASGLGLSLPDSSHLLRLNFQAGQQQPVVTRLRFVAQPLPLVFYWFDGFDLLPMQVAAQEAVVVIRTCTAVLDLGGDRSVCNGDSVLVEASCSGCQSIVWGDGSTGSVFWAAGSGPVVAVAAAPLRCSASDTVQVTEVPPMLIALDSAVVITAGEGIWLEASVQSTGAFSVEWSPDAMLSLPDALRTFAQPDSSTLYRLRVRDVWGCTAEGSVLVTVVEPIAESFFVPNAVSLEAVLPENTRFTVFAATDELFVRSLRVHDRWGNLVFERERFPANVPDMGWDARLGETAVAAGVYAYTLELLWPNGRAQRVAGNVTVLR